MLRLHSAFVDKGDTRRSAELGVVLVADTAETIAGVMRCLRAQTARDRLEIIIVGPIDRDAYREQDFARVQVVQIPTILSLEEARAVGVRHATAPIVFIGETHSFPHADFAEKLIEAHTGPWAAVQPAMENANPGGSIALSNLMLDYGRWLAPGRAREVENVPDFNCSFKREELLGGAQSVEELFRARNAVAQDLRRRGYRLYLEPAAKLSHLNVSMPGPWLAERYLAGRILGGARAAIWPHRRRLLYLAGSIAIPLVLFLRAARVARRLRLSWPRLAAVSPALFVGSLAWALGEVIGYIFGSGEAPHRMMEYELHKASYASGANGV